MGVIRSAGAVCLLVLGALACGNDEDDEDACPAPAQAITAPDHGASLSSVPACKLPDPEQ